jgi:hypothetical protein
VIYNSAQTQRLAIITFFLSTWFGIFPHNSIYLEYCSAATPGDESTIERRFETFKEKLRRRFEERIAKISSWISDEVGDRVPPVIASIKGPMIDRLRLIQDQFMNDLEKEPRKTKIRENLMNDTAIDTQVTKSYQEGDESFMKEFYKARADLVASLNPSHISTGLQSIIWIVSGMAFIFLVGGVFLIIREAKQANHELAEPAGLAKGTIRSIIVLTATYLIFVLALLDYLVRQRFSEYLILALGSFITFYFGSRAIDSYYSNRKVGFTFHKTFPDGTKERIQSYEQPGIATKRAEALVHYQDAIEKLRQVVEEIRTREEMGLGYVYGTITFLDSKTNKSAVKVTLEEISRVSKTNAAGFYLFCNVPPGSYTLKAEKDNFELWVSPQLVNLSPRGNVEVPPIEMKPIVSISET